MEGLLFNLEHKKVLLFLKKDGLRFSGTCLWENPSHLCILNDRNNRQHVFHKDSIASIEIHEK